LFEIDLNQTDVSGEVVCDKGHARVNIYCGTGSSLYVKDGLSLKTKN